MAKPSYIKRGISRAWFIFNMEFVPGAVCTSYERTLMVSLVAIVIGLVIYALVKLAAKVSHLVAI